MGLWNSLNGMLRTELTSADIADALSAANEQGITLYHLEFKSDLTVLFYILRKDFSKMEHLCEKRGEKLRILKKRGIYWKILALINRPVLLTGFLLFLALLFTLPARILFVQVVGNEQVAANRILEAAHLCGIRFGASRRLVRSEKVKNNLLSEIPELQWAGVNTFGCVAVISVREEMAQEKKEDSVGITNIVAARDGIVSNMTVTRGNGLCVQGQAVEEGQILISAYTDCGICIVATKAEGEITARTNREMEAITPAEYTSIGNTTEEKKKISLLIGKKLINLWKDSGIWDTSCGRMYKQYYVTFPGGFSLPVALVVETYSFRELSEAVHSEAAAFAALGGFAQGYLTEQMIGGSVMEKEEICVLENNAYKLRGTYVCTEMIGRERQEKIGDYYGENN